MTGALTAAVLAFNWIVLGYAILLAVVQLAVLAVASVHILRTLRRDVESRKDDVFAHPATPAVSVLMPAFNEELTVVESVRSVLATRYPSVETIVIEDGSTDRTFEALRDAFDLVEAPRTIPPRIAVTGAVVSVHSPRDGRALLVIRKENAGRVADALNAGLNAVRTPLVCMVDADSVIEPDALLHVVRPFVEQPDLTVAAGGVIRPSNGVRVRRGSVDDVRAPRGLLARAQIVEYLRAFLMGRVGWTGMQGLLIISGAFALFRTDDVLALGGLDSTSLGQDAELVASIHERLCRSGTAYRMEIVPQPVCWTEVPETRRDLARQRRRWSHGLAQVLWNHRAAIGRPRYGRFGMLVLPYHLIFELLGPVVEVLGPPVVVLSWALGLLNGPFAALILAASLVFGLLLSLTAMFLDEVTFHRYERWRDLGGLAMAAVVEGTVLRWWHAWWRLRGLLDFAFLRRRGWGDLTRRGFHAGATRPAG